MMDEATDGHTDELTATATGVSHHHHHLGMDHQHHLDEEGDIEHPEVAVSGSGQGVT